MLNQEMKGLVSTLMIARKEFIEYKLLDSSSVPKEMWERSTYSESCDVQEEANRCMGVCKVCEYECKMFTFLSSCRSGYSNSPF